MVVVGGHARPLLYARPLDLCLLLYDRPLDLWGTLDLCLQLLPYMCPLTTTICVSSYARPLDPCLLLYARPLDLCLLLCARPLDLWGTLDLCLELLLYMYPHTTAIR